MSLVCCLKSEDGCTCEKDEVCGGVHIINAQCAVHARASTTCSIHEIGARRIDSPVNGVAGSVL